MNGVLGPFCRTLGLSSQSFRRIDSILKSAGSKEESYFNGAHDYPDTFDYGRL
jgi:hypothetical protein